MEEKDQYQTAKGNRNTLAIFILAVVAIVVIVAAGSIAGIFTTVTGVDSNINTHDVPIVCTVSGNDLIVNILDSAISRDVVTLRVVLGSKRLAYDDSFRRVGYTDFPKEIRYDGILDGVHGLTLVSFEAKMKDGTEKVVWVETLRF